MSNLLSDTIKLSNGLVIDDRLRVGGMLFLEKLYEKPFTQINFTGDITMLMNMVLALAVQRDPDNADEIKKQIYQLDVSELASLTGKLKVFEKKVPSPVRTKKAKRKKAKTPQKK